jgi:hypothetical protein
MRHLQEKGFTPWQVERRIPYANVTMDLYNFGDIIAFGKGKVIICQTTSKENFFGRRAKIRTNETARKFVEDHSRNIILLHAWDSNGKLRELKITKAFWSESEN